MEMLSSTNRIWKHFVPEQDFHVFQRGAYFSTVVIPHRLAVVSLNTMFFYHSNTLVDGCPNDDDELAQSDPGTEELNWLEVQLQQYKSQKVQVYLTGHVPPSAANWYKGCYARYGQLSLKHQDTIVGHLYGHMNQDHFSLIDADDVRPDWSPSSRVRRDEPIRALASLDDQLLSQFKRLPKRKKTELDRYAVVNVAPSVVPTYQPAIRVWTYNVSEASVQAEPTCDKDAASRFRSAVRRLQLPLVPDRWLRAPCMDAAERAPIRSNRFLSPLAYTQFFVRLPRANKHGGYGPGKKGKASKEKGGARPPLHWEVEYTTATRERFLEAAVGEGIRPLLFPKELAPEGLANITTAEIPFLLAEADREDDEPEDDAEEDDPEDDKSHNGAAGVSVVKKKGKRRRWKKLVPWQMEELTLGSWIELARRLGKGKKAWSTFRRFMVVSAPT